MHRITDMNMHTELMQLRDLSYERLFSESVIIPSTYRNPAHRHAKYYGNIYSCWVHLGSEGTTSLLEKGLFHMHASLNPFSERSSEKRYHPNLNNAYLECPFSLEYDQMNYQFPLMEAVGVVKVFWVSMAKRQSWSQWQSIIRINQIWDMTKYRLVISSNQIPLLTMLSSLRRAK